MLCPSPVHTQLGTCPTNLTCCLSTSFQCYKVSCLEIPGPHGPKGYRGQKVRGLESVWPMLQEAPDLTCGNSTMKASWLWMTPHFQTWED